MLIIYSSLVMGGIETFFLRIAKERFKKGMLTKILLMKPEEHSSFELLSEIKLYSEVYFSKNLYACPGFLSSNFPLISPLINSKLVDMMSNIKHIHTTNGRDALLANKYINKLVRDVKVTVGFYHSLEYAWGDSKKLPYFENVNRDFIFNFLPKVNLYTFSDSTIDFYNKKLNVDLNGASSFRIGVIERSDNLYHKRFSKDGVLRICSVGRLTDFKTYNFWMLEVVSKLLKKGYKVKYDIYGSGPDTAALENKILKLNLKNNVILKGLIAYSDFDYTVSQYDFFVGSGTAIIQASSLGVPSIIGIESIKDAITYGYFKDFCKFDYNISSLPFKKVSVIEMMEEFLKLSDREKLALSQGHINCVEDFFMDTCSSNFITCGEIIKKCFNYSELKYELTHKYTALASRVFTQSAYRNKYFEKL